MSSGCNFGQEYLNNIIRVIKTLADSFSMTVRSVIHNFNDSFLAEGLATTLINQQLYIPQTIDYKRLVHLDELSSIEIISLHDNEKFLVLEESVLGKNLTTNSFHRKKAVCKQLSLLPHDINRNIKSDLLVTLPPAYPNIETEFGDPYILCMKNSIPIFPIHKDINIEDIYYSLAKLIHQINKSVSRYITRFK
jgi:hypothetical protein